MKKYLVTYLTLPLILLAPLIFFIKYNQYGFFHVEVLLLAFFIVLFALLGVFLKKFSDTLGFVIVNMFYIVLAVSFFTHGEYATIILLVTALISSLLMTWLKDDFDEMVLIMVIVFIAAIVLFSVKSETAVPIIKDKQVSKVNKSLPPVFHIILDAHIGINALPKDMASSLDLKTLLEKFYLKNDFRLYTNAYSHYVRTFNSIPNLLNFSASNLSGIYVYSVNTHKVLLKNKYFKLMHQAGYNIRVYQSGYLEYCQKSPVPLTSCYSYPYAGIKAIQPLNLSLINKTIFIFKSFLLSSSLYNKVMRHYQYSLRPNLERIGINLPEWKWYQARTASVYMPDVFQHLKADALKHPNGTLFYVHILSPHNPYVYDANCHIVKEPEDWQINLGPNPFANSIATRKYRYQLYENQLRCVTKQLQSFFTELKQHHLYKKSIIIINADHGSRIMINPPYINNKNKLTKRDINDAFAALFAVKAPGFTVGIDKKPLALQMIFAKIIHKITGKAIAVANSKPYFYLISNEEVTPMAIYGVKS